MLGNRRLRFHLDWTTEICSAKMKFEPSIIDEHGLPGWANTHAVALGT